MRLLAVLSALAALACVASSGASAQVLECGAVVTSDVTLEASLSGCSAGLVAGADGITIDLNGFAIEGVGADAGAGWGIEVPRDRSGVTVRNGSIRGFAQGVHVNLTNSSTVENLTVTDSSIGIFLVGATNVQVLGNSLLNNLGEGIHCRFSNEAEIRGNYSVGNHIGILLEFGCEHSALVSNVASENRTFGIWKEQSGGTVEGNTANGNGLTGIYSLNSHGTFFRNVTNANGRDGLRVADTVPLPNHAAAHTIAENVANANGGYGIAATRFDFGDDPFLGVIDGGKNRAHANRGATQCITVFCK